MKKSILATLLFVALSIASFASGNKAGEELFSNLNKTLQQSASVQWSTNADFRKGAFTFNGKQATAYYTADENDLSAFTIDLAISDISKEASDYITNKFAGWTITKHIMLINSEGETGYFAQVTKGKNSLALKINPNGKAFIVAKIPY